MVDPSRATDNDAMPPALADQHSVAHAHAPKAKLRPLATVFTDPVAGSSSEDPPAPAAIQEIGRPLVDAALLRTVGRDQRAVGRRRKRVDGA